MVQIRRASNKDRILQYGTVAATLLKDIGNVSGQPCIQGIPRVSLLIMEAVQRARHNKSSCMKLTERAHELVCAIINICRDSDADLTTAMVRSIVQYSETLDKILIFVRNQVKPGLIRIIFRSMDDADLIKECVEGLKHALDVFGVQSGIIAAMTMAEMQKEAKQRHEELIAILKKRRLRAEAAVTAVLSNQEQKRVLLDTTGGSLDDALRACDQRICTSLLAVLGSRNAKRAVLALESGPTQSFMDAVQDVPDRGSLTSGRTFDARRLIIRLSEARGLLPSSLFIARVTDRREYATVCGGFSDIYRAMSGGRPVALKRLRRFQEDTDSRSRLQFCREALVWQTLRHQYILPLIGIDRDTFPSSFCMVSPWMEYGTVLKFLKDRGRGDVQKMLLQITEGLGYLHSMKIVHGDLRGTNILVSDDGNACLADFGLTRVIDDVISDTSGALGTSSNHAGSVRWFAPELIDPTLFGCERFVRTPASDVYAFACVCLEAKLLTGRRPFSEVPQDITVMLKVRDGERPARPAAMSDTLWELVTAAWAPGITDRPRIEKIIESMKMISDPKGAVPTPQCRSKRSRYSWPSLSPAST
ncbi:kinase-like domain-containing protein [Mycena polygramma]|nr:kinase-like domain-containing protein [Mycena polygramma]